MDRTNRRSTLPGEVLNYSPPHDVAAERAVLAVLLLDPGAADNCRNANRRDDLVAGVAPAKGD